MKSVWVGGKASLCGRWSLVLVLITMCAGAAEQGLPRKCATQNLPREENLWSVFLLFCVLIYFCRPANLWALSHRFPIRSLSFSVPVSVQSHFSLKWSHLSPHQGACFSAQICFISLSFETAPFCSSGWLQTICSGPPLFALGLKECTTKLITLSWKDTKYFFSP